jgi:glycine/D-amino acid oxidase-like deaminating enzyme
MAASKNPTGRAGKRAGGDTYEAVVVGAGLVGAAMVANLAAEGIDVAVLEAGNVAAGATSRASGLVPTGAPIPYARLAEERGRDMARSVWELTVDNREKLTTIADRLGETVKRTGSLVLARNPDEAELLEQSAHLLDEDGFEVRFEKTDPLNRGFAGALHYPEDVVVDPASLTKRLLEAYDVPIQMNTEVYGLKQDGDSILVQARGYMVRANTVVLAVNAYAPLIDRYFADKIAPVSGYTLVSQPIKDRLVLIPGNVGSFSFRQTPDGRMFFTAWSSRYEISPTGPKDDSTEINLMRFVGRHFPEAAGQFIQRESSVLGSSRDGLPLTGALPHLPQVFFAVGFGGYGLSMAFAAADLLTGLIVRGAEPALLSARRLESQSRAS